jgi:hypothetical protein
MSGGFSLRCTACLLPARECVCPYVHLPDPPFLPSYHAQPFRCAINHRRPNPFDQREKT